MMPVDRSSVIRASAGNVGAMASADAHNAAIVLYNNGTTDATTLVQLTHLPFWVRFGGVYFIDQNHASYLDGASENIAPSIGFL